MTTPKSRPSTARKVTRKTEENRESGLDQGARITIDGEVYEARIGDVTAVIARELRQKQGVGFVGLLNALATDPDVDVLSAFVWVARRVAGEQVRFEDVNVTYAQLAADGFDFEQVTTGEQVDGSPEE